MTSLTLISSDEDILGDSDPVFEDTDEAYDYWLKQDWGESTSVFNKDALIQQMFEANKVQLMLNKDTNTTFNSNIMRQHSIQVNVFEALILHETLEGNHQNWTLKMNASNNEYAKFKLKSCNSEYGIEMGRFNHSLSILKNDQAIGKLDIEIEQQVIEKIVGQLNLKPFIIDPIWKQSQTTIDAVKLVLGKYATEVVHHPKHNQTLWHGSNGAQIMTIKKNKTHQINQNLFLNRKMFEFSNTKIYSIQWFCPWQRLPIVGNIIVILK